MKTLRFYKENSEWYADIPEWEGLKSALQMVLGADTLLDELSNYKEEITLHLTTEVQEIRNLEGIPAFANHNWDFLIRADYVKTYEGKYYTGYNEKYIWLCPVTAFVFGEYPQYIYYKIVKNEDNQG